VLPGPRDDWFAAGAIELLCGADYLVTPASDRTGLRLDGPALPRAITRELASEGMFTGALQIPRRQADPAARRPPRHRRLSGDRRRPVRGHRQGRAVAAWPAGAEASLSASKEQRRRL